MLPATEYVTYTKTSSNMPIVNLKHSTYSCLTCNNQPTKQHACLQQYLSLVGGGDSPHKSHSTLSHSRNWRMGSHFFTNPGHAIGSKLAAVLEEYGRVVPQFWAKRKTTCSIPWAWLAEMNLLWNCNRGQTPPMDRHIIKKRRSCSNYASNACYKATLIVSKFPQLQHSSTILLGGPP